ncbi:DUF2958 domain-containing protein [Pelagerythrobacter aerophilus]|uniref:DUF2958 domain-containing protein n=1 Tax=Pelagerythrobacter aerophilus TaxID=2306995 RepID=A0A418NIR1_9SPHN|nr:DUF2958 domain-containing protein [Pelagerythrobacter aerophilus]
MIDLPPHLVRGLRLNTALSQRHAERGQAFDPWPVIKLFNPAGAATWIATELHEDGDALFGLADLGFGCPELGRCCPTVNQFGMPN